MTHHDQIFRSHVEKLNRTLQPYPALQRRPLTQLLLHPDCLPWAIKAEVAEHGGAVYNHTLYFPSLAPARSTTPQPLLTEAVCRCFGSMEDLLRTARGGCGSSLRRGRPQPCRCGPFCVWICIATPTSSPMETTGRPT